MDQERLAAALALIGRRAVDAAPALEERIGADFGKYRAMLAGEVERIEAGGFTSDPGMAAYLLYRALAVYNGDDAADVIGHLIAALYALSRDDGKPAVGGLTVDQKELAAAVAELGRRAAQVLRDRERIPNWDSYRDALEEAADRAHDGEDTTDPAGVALALWHVVLGYQGDEMDVLAHYFANRAWALVGGRASPRPGSS
jgi:hypothetical protein